MNKIAKGNIPIGPLEGPGKWGIVSAPFSTFNNIISTIISIMTVVAAIWFIFVLISGAIGWISAGGDKASLETAKKKITNGIVGIVVVVAAVFLADILGELIGLDILNPGNILKSLTQ